MILVQIIKLNQFLMNLMLSIVILNMLVKCKSQIKIQPKVQTNILMQHLRLTEEQVNVIEKRRRKLIKIINFYREQKTVSDINESIINISLACIKPRWEEYL